MKTKKLLILPLTTLFFVSNPHHAHAQLNPFQTNLKDMFPAAQNLPNPGSGGVLSTFLNPIVSFVPIVTGILSFIIIIIAGIKYISHAGNAQETKKVNDMITYALVGLALSAIAFWVTRLLFMVGAGDSQNLF